MVTDVMSHEHKISNNSKSEEDRPFWVKVRVNQIWKVQLKAELIIQIQIRRKLIFFSALPLTNLYMKIHISKRVQIS